MGYLAALFFWSSVLLLPSPDLTLLFVFSVSGLVGTVSRALRITVLTVPAAITFSSLFFFLFLVTVSPNEF